jgi:glutathione reductase (NADPH)
VLVGAAEVIDMIRRMKGKGVIDFEGVKINWHDLMHFKRSFTEPVPKEREQQLSKVGIVAYWDRRQLRSC